MSEFLLRSACRGHRPPVGASSRRVSRPALIARLLRERHVARFIVAPDGFGKTSLALEYADTVFSFEHVFWIDGGSPCFLRDVDECCLASSLFAAEAKPFLAVIDDVPPLDHERAEKLSRELDALLDRDCEVLASCVPACDAFERHRDRIKLSASDLLLSDGELDALRLPSACQAEPASSIPRSRRIAGLAWGPEDGQGAFLEAAIGGELPGDVLLSLFVMLALEEGQLSDLAAFGAFDEAQAAFLAEGYPYVGVDLREERFEAAPFSAEDLASAFDGKLDLAAACSKQVDRDRLVERVADVLVSRRGFERACDLMRLLASRPSRVAWLSERGGALMEGACLLPASRLYRTLAGGRDGRSARLAAGEAVRCALLGDKKGACAEARRAAGEDAAPLRDRAVAALVMADCGDAAARRRAGELLESLVAAAFAGAEPRLIAGRDSLAALGAVRALPTRASQQGEGEAFDAGQDPSASEGLEGASPLASASGPSQLRPAALPVSDASFLEDSLDWVAAARVQGALGRSCGEAAEEWLSWRELGFDGGMSEVSASWVLRGAMARRGEEAAAPGAAASGGAPAPGVAAGGFAGGGAGGAALAPAALVPATVERLGAIVRSLICDGQGPMGLARAIAGGAYEEVCGTGLWTLRELDAQTSFEVRSVELSLFEQRRARERLALDRAESDRVFCATHPDLARAPAGRNLPSGVVLQEPLLTVNLFGGLEVFIGDEPVDPKRLRRKKTQTLLALLVLNRGHEIPRKRLVGLLWPESDPDKARNNFYTLWSDLRRALTTPAGTCPYLIRRQQGVRLDPKLLRSDVDQMEEVCRKLLFKQPGFGGWSQLYDQVERQFSEDLVPGDADNEAIESIRIDYRNRLVDALVAASKRLVAAGEVQEGLWFARAALQRDRTREDAYAALMAAQLASGQRAAALETYFSCRHFLAEELGIDPSTETVRLYREIIDSEEDFR